MFDVVLMCQRDKSRGQRALFWAGVGDTLHSPPEGGLVRGPGVRGDVRSIRHGVDWPFGGAMATVLLDCSGKNWF